MFAKKLCIVAVLAVAFALVSAAPERGQRLIALGEDDEGTWMTKLQVMQLVQDDISFMDITDRPETAMEVPEGPPLPNQPQQKALVNSLNQQLDMDNMQSNVEILSSYKTRFYSTETGVEASDWIHDTLLAYADGRSDVTVSYFFANTTFPQRSVIASIAGTQSTDKVIIGSHEDSIVFGAFGTAPGVDDDGSGTVSNLEVFRVLMLNGFQPNRTLEFHFYAAEEVGLLGSQAVANKYAAAETVVVGMLQLDMDFYIGTDDEDIVGIVTDYTDPDLTRFLRQLVDAYAAIDWVDTECGYGCSDHASWTAVGYRAVFPFESEFNKKNPYIHTSQDTLAHATLAHGLEFAKVSLGMAVELSATEYDY